MHQGHIFYVHDGNKEVDQALYDQLVVYAMKMMKKVATKRLKVGTGSNSRFKWVLFSPHNKYLASKWSEQITEQSEGFQSTLLTNFNHLALNSSLFFGKWNIAFFSEETDIVWGTSNSFSRFLFPFLWPVLQPTTTTFILHHDHIIITKIMLTEVNHNKDYAHRSK